MVFLGRFLSLSFVPQFIPFRDYFHKGAAHLAKDTLAEVPEQFIAYCKAKGILPSAPLTAPPTPNVYK